MSSTSSNTGEFTYNELMEQYVKATRLIEHLKSQRNRSKRAFDKAMDLVLKYDVRIAELEEAQKEALSLLPELERGHYYCDDCWYSCPKAVDGCCDESRGDECDCGADNYNALLAKIVGLLTPEVQE